MHATTLWRTQAAIYAAVTITYSSLAISCGGPSVPTYIGALAVHRTGLMVGGDFRGSIGAVCFSNAVRVNTTTRIPE